MRYNETIAEVYIDKRERIKLESSNNHNTDRLDIYSYKPKQKIKRKDQGEQEVIKTEITKKMQKMEK